MQTGEKHAAPIAHHVGDDRAVREFQRERGLDQLRGDPEKLGREAAELLLRQAAMPLVHRLRQGVADASADPDHRGWFDAKPHGDGVGGLEADAADVAGQAIRVLRHHLHGVDAIGLENPHRARSADAVAVQEHHDLADDLLVGPGADDALGAHRADARNLPQALGRAFDHVEHRLSWPSFPWTSICRRTPEDGCFRDAETRDPGAG